MRYGRILATTVPVCRRSVACRALARAQVRSSLNLPRIGILQAGSQSAPSPFLEAFQQGLRELGYVDGRTIALEYRWANGELDQLPRLAAELAGMNLNVIFAPVTPVAVAAKGATNAIPIVFAQVNDPVGTGLVSSLAGLAQMSRAYRPTIWN